MNSNKKYRLPTEAEWEYAARGGTKSTYFFEGNVKDYAVISLKSKLMGVDTSVINSYVIYDENSRGKTESARAVAANPYGLKHMLGNVAEFCLDIYDKDAYGNKTHPSVNPAGPGGEGEHVIRGGSFRSNAMGLRLANRDKTSHDAWMKTDPQIPKSLWWYSDSYHVGFRVVCEYGQENNTN